MIKKMLTLTLTLNSITSLAGISTFFAWNREEIKVCFAGKGTEVRVKGMPNGFAQWNDKQKQFMADVVNKEFTPERTGYSFVGFDDCDAESRPDVIIVRKGNLSPHALSVRGSATLGMGLLNASPTYQTAKGAVLFTATGISNHATIVHEFGHILGLKHEHDHPDAKAQAGSWCMEYSSKNEHLRYNMYTAFDEDSVMNYCKIRKDRGIGLSLGDVEHIRALYNYSSIRNKREFN